MAPTRSWPANQGRLSITADHRAKKIITKPTRMAHIINTRFVLPIASDGVSAGYSIQGRRIALNLCRLLNAACLGEERSSAGDPLEVDTSRHALRTRSA